MILWIDATRLTTFYYWFSPELTTIGFWLGMVSILLGICSSIVKIFQSTVKYFYLRHHLCRVKQQLKYQVQNMIGHLTYDWLKSSVINLCMLIYGIYSVHTQSAIIEKYGNGDSPEDARAGLPWIVSQFLLSFSILQKFLDTKNGVTRFGPRTQMTVSSVISAFGIILELINIYQRSKKILRKELCKYAIQLRECAENLKKDFENTCTEFGLE